MHYTLHQLRIFLKVHECQSITKAAEELFLTQPAVSIQLKKLQDQFDIPLTEVIGRKLFITDFGNEIAARSRRILDETDAIKYTVDRFKGLVTGKISISVVSTGKYVIPFFLRDFLDEHPGVDVSIDVSNKLKVVEGLHANESDFSLVSVLPDSPPLNTVELLENRLYLVKGRSLDVDITKPKDLEAVTLVFRENGSATRTAMEEYLQKHRVKVSKKLELVSNEAVKQAVTAGLGVSIVPLIGLRNAIKTGAMSIVPMRGLPMRSRWSLVYNKGKKLTPAQAALVSHIEQNKDQIAHRYFEWALED